MRSAQADASSREGKKLVRSGMALSVAFLALLIGGTGTAFVNAQRVKIDMNTRRIIRPTNRRAPSGTLVALERSYDGSRRRPYPVRSAVNAR